MTMSFYIHDRKNTVRNLHLRLKWMDDTENRLLFQTLPTLLYLDNKEMHHQFFEDFK